MEGGTGIKVLWFCESNTSCTALRNKIWATVAFKEMFASREILSKLLVAMERTGQKLVRHKQHRAGTVLALSSLFVKGKHEGKRSLNLDESAT